MLAERRNERNRTLALEAVRLSKQDIADALAQRTAYPEPAPTTTFQAELLVPFPVTPSQDRWTGRVPTYTVGPEGTSVEAPDDYTRTRDRIIADEGPGIVASFFNDDNQIRAWVATHGLAIIGRQPVNEKIRMIHTLLNGWVSDEDLVAIRRLCRSNPGDMAAIRTAIAPRIRELTDLGQRTQLRLILGTI
jgi:hypothetical protein